MASLAGSECRLQNPWGEAEVMVFREGKKAEIVRGSPLKFSTRNGEIVVLVQPGTTPAQFKRSVLGRGAK